MLIEGYFACLLPQEATLGILSELWQGQLAQNQ